MTGIVIILEWIRLHEYAFWWLGTLSVATFVGTLLVIPILIVRISSDYFMYNKPNPDRSHLHHSTLRRLSLILKNLFGIIFILAGLIMLLLPGQGLITILVGMTLLDFPGKRTLELWIVQRPLLLRTINGIRARAHKPPLQIPKRKL